MMGVDLFSMHAAIIRLLVIGGSVFFTIWFLSGMADRLDLLDDPTDRKRHEGRVPLVGGLAIYFSQVFAVWYFNAPFMVQVVLSAAGMIVVVGLIDDLRGLGIRVRLLSQAVASLIVIMASEVYVQTITVSSEVSFVFNVFYGTLITVFLVTGVVNAVNMADGMDGLASSYVLIGLLSLMLVLFVNEGYVYQLDWLILFFAAISVFLVINLRMTPLKKVFLGDAGSTMLGFVFGWLLIWYSQPSVSMIGAVDVLWCFTIPVYDAFAVVMARSVLGGSPFKPDRSHLHHLMLATGLSARKTLVYIILATLATNLLGFAFAYYAGGVWSFIAYFFGFGVFISIRRWLITGTTSVNEKL